MESFLEIKGLNYTINKEKILNNVSFDIKNQGDIVCILGPSGIGKTTILKSIAGLRKIDSGSIILNKKTLTDNNNFIFPEDRNIALSFQDNALFPHYTVEENIEFGIKRSLFCSKNKNGPLKYSIDELLDLFFIPELKKNTHMKSAQGNHKEFAWYDRSYIIQIYFYLMSHLQI